MVSNEAGDFLEVAAAHPSFATSTESGYKVACSAGTATPYRGSLYSVCGEIYAYDATEDLPKSPRPTNPKKPSGTLAGRRSATAAPSNGTPKAT